MIFNSIRWRLQLWYGLILVLVLTMLGLTARHVDRENQLARIDHELEQQLGSVMSPRNGPMDREDFSHRGGLDMGGPPARGQEMNDQRPGDWNVDMGGPDKHHADDIPRLNEFRGGPRKEFFLSRLRNSIQNAVKPGFNPTNSAYFIAWQTDGAPLASSTNAPSNIPAPPHEGTAGQTSTLTNALEGWDEAPSSPNMFAQARTRGIYREVYRFMPFGDCVLIGRSMAPELAAMDRLNLWLTVAGGGILFLGLAGGWWVASRAIRPIDAISATAVKIAGGDLSQRIAASDTESELGRLAGVLNSTFARLDAAFSQQSRFTSDASHELRTPLAVILSQTQTTLARERTSQEYRDALAACQRAAGRMRNLTESLLQLARLDAGQDSLKRAKFDLGRVVRDSVELVRSLADERQITIHCESAEVPCVGDAERISQVTTNLLTNAIHYNHPKGEVRLSVRSEAGFAVLSVTDTGDGISPEDMPHLFGRFYRVEKSRSRSLGGTGLGLAICKAIVDAHSGTIVVTSQPGFGSTFSLRLPASAK